jgi:hypothetical protein
MTFTPGEFVVVRGDPTVGVVIMAAGVAVTVRWPDGTLQRFDGFERDALKHTAEFYGCEEHAGRVCNCPGFTAGPPGSRG